MRAAALSVLLAGACGAATLSPSDLEIAKALKAGAALVNPNSGYPLKENVLYEVPDARDAKSAWGDVDPVVLATPLERTRHAGYIAKMSSRSIDVTAARKLPELRSGSLLIMVYAHGSNSADESFVERFGAASLVFAEAIVPSDKATHSELSEGTYPLADADRDRLEAVVTYRFEMRAYPQLANSPCRVKFVDPTGKTFDIPVTLAQYR